MISFKANLINTTTVDRINPDSSYTRQKVAFVELDHTSDSDIECLKAVNKKWNRETTFADDILSDMLSHKTLLEKYDYNEQLDERRFFAITRQQSDYSSLNATKIIALAEMKKDYDYPYYELDLLQVKPSLKKGKDSTVRKIKNIGRSMVQSILSLYKDKTIIVEPLKSAMGFYDKLGFKLCKESNLSGMFTNKTMAYIRHLKP